MGTKIGTAIAFAVIWLKGQFSRFAKDRQAVSTVEYALIVIAVIAIVGTGAALLGGAFNNLFAGLENNLNNTVADITS